MKKVRKSNSMRLVNYITSNQGKQERVGVVSVSNCFNSDAIWAAKEIMATQALNQRAKGDKTYHLMISFAEGESPTHEQLKKIEERVVDSIGLNAHQRISAVHHDTEKVHIHVAINKIHPQKLIMIEPYRAYKTLGAVAEALEIEFGFQRTNHKAKKCHSENLAEDMEHHTGIQSLIGWIKRNCLSSLETSTHWCEVHKILSEHGLNLKIKANGLIICHDNGLTIKASSVSRNLSKAKLETRLGPFQPAKDSNEGAVAKQFNYEYQPKSEHEKAAASYFKYKAERISNKQKSIDSLTQARLQKDKLIEQAKHRGQLKRKAIKLIKSSQIEKKLLYALVSKTLRNELKKIHLHYQQKRSHIFNTYRNYSWADWLKKQALSGDKESLNVMRHRKKQPKASYSLSGSHSNEDSFTQEGLDSLTKTGTAIYRFDSCTIRDNGKELSITRSASIQGLKKAIELAKQQFGALIRISGSALFKETIVHVAAFYQIAIQFDDPKMEALRQQLIHTKKGNNEHTKRPRKIHRRAVKRRNETVRTRNDRREATRIGSNTRPGTKPYLSRFGKEPPPQGQNRLRSMSELPMVQFTGRREVLLPVNAYPKLERKRTQSNNSMRRPVFGLKL